MFKGICVPKSQYSPLSISIKPYYNRWEYITDMIPWGTNRFDKLRNHYTWRVNTLTFKLKRFTVKKTSTLNGHESRSGADFGFLLNYQFSICCYPL